MKGWDKNEVKDEPQVSNLGDWDEKKGIPPSRKFRKTLQVT